MTRKALLIAAVTSGCSALSALYTGERWVFLIAVVLCAVTVMVVDFLFRADSSDAPAAAPSPIGRRLDP